MKKFILFSGFFYLISFFSCQEKNNKESFADIIKNDSSRVQELLDVAAQFNNTPLQQNKSFNTYALNDSDALDDKQLADFRSEAGHARWGDKKYPTIIVSSQSLLELTGEHPGDLDSLIFYLGMYPQKDTMRVRRYNERYHNIKYNYNMLKRRITFVVQSKDGKGFKSSKLYDFGRLCPPPPSGCF